MAVHHPGDLPQELGNLQHTINQLVRQAVQNASFGSAGLRVYGGGWVTIENGGLSVTGSALVSGTAEITGLLSVTGRLLGSGEFVWSGPWELSGDGDITGDVTGTGRLDWDGPWNLNGTGKITGNTTGTGDLIWIGPWDLRGAGQIKGNVDITGALDVLNRLTLGPSGYIEAGTVRIDRAGSHGGRIASTGTVLELSAAGGVIIDAPGLTAYDGSFRDLSAYGTVSGHIKTFKIPHPNKVDHLLRHGATESPVSGVEYWGEETLPDSGELQIRLPDYFEALTKEQGRAVLVTARGFIADWGDIEDGSFTVTGTPGGRFSWLVKAEREGADFPLEEPVFGPIRESN